MRIVAATIMRIVAGTIMIILGIVVAFFLVGLMMVDINHYGVPVSQYLLSPYIFMVLAAVFIVTGEVFCLMRRYWKVCFSSALLLLFLMIYFVIAFFWGTYRVFIPLVGILPIAFVYVSRREWQKSQA